MHELVDRWRTRAKSLREWAAAEGAAAAFERAAIELEAELADHDDEVLSLNQAAHESRYSAEHLRRMIREGKLPNAGRKGSPRIRRRDLPTKPGTRPFGTESEIASMVVARFRKKRHLS